MSLVGLTPGISGPVGRRPGRSAPVGLRPGRPDPVGFLLISGWNAVVLFVICLVL